MKLPIVFLALLAAGSLSARIQTASECYVAAAIAIPPATDEQPMVTSFSFPFFCQPVNAGLITDVADNWLFDANADWSAGAYDPGPSSYFILTETGLSYAILVTDAVLQRLQLLEPIGPESVGLRYTIYRHHTLASLFGDGPGWIGRSSNFATADNVLLTGLAENQTSLFFYSDFPGHEGWYDASYLPVGEQTIFPESGVYYVRRLLEGATLGMSGRCLKGPYLARLGEGYSLVGTLEPSTALTFAEARLYVGDPDSGLVAGENHTIADKVFLGEGSFFYSNVPGNIGWYNSAYEPAGDVVIQPTQTILIQRRAGHGNFTWQLGPQP